MSSSTLPLQGLDVLITRPSNQSGEWQTALEAGGAKTRLAPMLEIEPVEDKAGRQAIKDKILELDQYHSAIFVSQNAVTYACQWIDQYWPQLPVGINWLAVGGKTGELLQSEGFDAKAADRAMNSETLLELNCLKSLNLQKILIFRGCGGRPLLGQVLQERGASVDYCEMYHRVLPQEAKHRLESLEWSRDSEPLLSAHSGESLKNLRDCLPAASAQHWLAIPVLVPGGRVAEQAREAGFTRVISAENATTHSMLQALVRWRQSNLDGKRNSL